jgi:hypothetical protein
MTIQLPTLPPREVKVECQLYNGSIVYVTVRPVPKGTLPSMMSVLIEGNLRYFVKADDRKYEEGTFKRGIVVE